MIRPLAFSLAAAIALATSSLCLADEDFPVVHNEPIAVRILSGKSGQPLPHMHLILIGGYDQNDLHQQLFREEALTNAQGVARLSNQLANLPWLQVWISKKPLCQSNPRKTGFSVELIRREGLSAPNRCGFATAEDAPGLFNVFVKGEAERGALAKILHVKGSPKIPAPTPAPTTAPAFSAPAQKPAQAEAAPPAPQPPMAIVAVVVPATTAPVPMEMAVKTAPPAKETTAPAVVPVDLLQAAPAKAAAVSAVKRASVRTAAHRISPAARRVASGAHRAKPVLVSCAVDLPPAKAARSAVTIPSAPDAKSDESKTARARARALGSSLMAKPAAGVRLSDAKPANSGAPPKHE